MSRQRKAATVRDWIIAPPAEFVHPAGTTQGDRGIKAEQVPDSLHKKPQPVQLPFDEYPDDGATVATALRLKGIPGNAGYQA